MALPSSHPSPRQCTTVETTLHAVCTPRAREPKPRKPLQLTRCVFHAGRPFATRISRNCNFTKPWARRSLRLMQTLEDRFANVAFEPPPDHWQALESERDRLRLLLEVSESIA